MNLEDCYRLLGLTAAASPSDIKAAYRRLARQYHPDLNAGRGAAAKFASINQAYQRLLQAAQAGTANLSLNEPAAARPIKVTDESWSVTDSSVDDQQLKWSAYQQLQQLLRSQRYARATVLMEGLAQRLPQDLEVRQWQAITYQQWGRQLLGAGQREKARSYLKKALQTDPHNRSLWLQIQEDLRCLERF
ncbi:MAG: DnaJ domain-containing protein [Chloroflexaceae bacterium]|nr:DnaJ domain-containing protein [Chloroflexaceae bacterium]